ncbi:MAG: hypothetical protein ACPF8W_00105 [Luminiphilus sp.]
MEYARNSALPPYMQPGFIGYDMMGYPMYQGAGGSIVTENPETVSARRTTAGERAEDYLANLGIPRSSSRAFFGGAQVGATDPLQSAVGDIGLASLLPVTSTAYGVAKVANQEPEGMIDLALAPLDYFGLRHAYRTARQAPELVELTQSPQTRTYFQDILKRAQDSQGPIGKQVDVYEPEEYEGMTLMASPNADAGFAITPEGEIVSLVKNADSPMKGFASKSLAEAAPNGGVFLNAFDTFLTDLYGKNGYRAVSRIPFDEDVMRDSIGDEATEAFMDAARDYNEGKPDLVFMVKDPDTTSYVRGEGEMLDDYMVARGRLDPFVERERRLYEDDILRRLRRLSTR